MHDPDPQPPTPRPISAARWLLLLTPAVLATAAPWIGAFMRRFHIYEYRGVDFTPELRILVVAAVLSLGLGFSLEKWRWGVVKEWERPLGYGLLILIVNGFIAFAGCALPGMIF